jgi:hypothetical protein
MAGMVAAGNGLARRFTERQRRRAASVIETPANLETAEARARRWQRFAIANYFGRIQTIAVSASLWQTTVLRLAAHADVILVDVSVPGPSLLWEIRTLRDLYRERLVVISAWNTAAAHPAKTLRNYPVP